MSSRDTRLSGKEPSAARTPSKRAGSYFALATDLEAAVGSLPSVRGVRVVTGDQEIEEIHVVSEPAVQPKRLVRDIVTLLFVRFGMRIDHRRVSIVGGTGQLGTPTSGRPILESVRPDPAAGCLRAELRFGDQVITGESPLDSVASEIKAASSATLDAIGRLLGREGELTAREAQVLAFGGEQVVIVLVHWQTGDRQAVLVGTSLSEQDPLVAAARATLDAVNRRLVRLPGRAE